MNGLQRMGGVSALIEAATFLIGFGLFSSMLAPAISADIDPVQKVAFLAENQALLYASNVILYLVFGIFLVVLVLALYERLKAVSPAMMQTATAFGLIWAGLVIASGMIANIGTGIVVDLYAKDPTQAGWAWLAIEAVVDGLGGGNEFVGALWVLLISWVALRGGGLPRVLNYLGVLIGVAGIVTIVPALGELGAVFGLGLIVWFIWVGIVLLRSKPGAAA